MSKRKPRRKPLGKPPAKAANEMAEVTPEDIERAKAHAEKHAPPELLAMLNAINADDEAFNA